MTLAPGIHTLDAERYHADPCEQPSLSASLAHVLVKRTPLHARQQHPRLNPDHRPKESGTLDHGTAAHALLFEGKQPLVIEGFDDWRKQAARTARDAARAEGLVPLLAKDAATVQAMCDAIARQLDEHEAQPRPFTDGKAEQTLVWTEPNGVTCRARLDWLRDDHTAIDDLKTTTTADPYEWSRRRLWEDGKDIQAAFYVRGLRALTGTTPEWRFVVVENTAPYALSVISLNADALALAEQKVEKVIGIWGECLQSGHWPGYPTQTCYAELPPWEESRFLEKEVLTEMGVQ